MFLFCFVFSGKKYNFMRFERQDAFQNALNNIFSRKSGKKI